MTAKLLATPDACPWGYFDAALASALTVASGAEVAIETVSGGPDQIPARGSGFDFPPELFDIHDRAPRQLPCRGRRRHRI